MTEKTVPEKQKNGIAKQRLSALAIGSVATVAFSAMVFFGGRSKTEGLMTSPSASANNVELDPMVVKDIEPKGECDPNFGFRNPLAPQYKAKCGRLADGKVQAQYETTSDNPIPGKVGIDYDFACEAARKTGVRDEKEYPIPEVVYNKSGEAVSIRHVNRKLDESCYPKEPVQKEEEVAEEAPSAEPAPPAPKPAPVAVPRPAPKRRAPKPKVPKVKVVTEFD